MATRERDYSKGKIYKIEPIIDHDEGDIYIGSTTKEYLSQRMQNHRSKYKLWKTGKLNKKISAYNLFDTYGIENCVITLLQNFPCKSNDELRAKETEFIQSVLCVNKTLPYRSKEEQRVNKQLKKQEYDTILKETKQRYYDKNKDLVNQKRAQKYTCECGSTLRIGDKSTHNKTKKHIDWMQSQ